MIKLEFLFLRMWGCFWGANDICELFSNKHAQQKSVPEISCWRWIFQSTFPGITNTIALENKKLFIYLKETVQSMAAIKRKAPLATRSHNFKESHPKSFRTFGNACNFNNKETLAQRPATLTKRDSNTCVFLWILQTFKNNFFIEYLRWLLLNLGTFPQRF